jgi:nucleoside-diphosphate-sugar epimerase
MPSNCLVTGGAGFIGSHIAENLVKQGERVRVLDNFSTGKEENLIAFRDDVELLRGDLADPEDCRRAVKGVEYVFHHGAIPSVPVSVKDPVRTHQSNITGTLNLLVAARDAGVRRLVYAASSAVYGDDPVLPKTETMKPAPLSPYAIQKYVGELYCRNFFDLYGLETVSLRYFNVFGPRQDPLSLYAAVIPRFITALGRGTAPTVYGDGEQTRDFIYVDNVVKVNLLAAREEKAAGSVINVAEGKGTSLNQILDTLQQLMGTEIDPMYADPVPGDVKHSIADIRLLQTLLRFTPPASFEEGLKKTIAFFRP